MDLLPTLTEDDVRRRVGQAPFDRGRHYFREGHIRRPRREGRTLRAVCQGSAPEPYRLHATFGAGGITDADCSCPIGDGGRCKHIAALLLAWIDAPDTFEETEPLAQRLEAKSKADLVALIQRMMVAHPPLEDLLAMAVPARGEDGLAVDTVERQVRRAFDVDVYEWGAAENAASELRPLAAMAEVYVDAADWPSVLTLCRGILTGILEHYERMRDDEGELVMVADLCIAPLGACLESATDPDLRREVIALLYESCSYDFVLGGIDFAYDAEGLLKAHATPEERRALCHEIQADLDRLPGRSGRHDWQREALGGLLLSLHPDPVDDATFLRIARDAGRAKDVVTRLLALDRVDDAREAVRDLSDYDLWRFAPLFVDTDHGTVVEALVLDRLGSGTDRRLVEWLKDRARARGDDELAIDLAERLFDAAPTAARYAEVIALARSLGREDAVRDAIRQRLRKKNSYAALPRAYLHDGEPDEALKLLYLPQKDWWQCGGFAPLRLAVADALAVSRPEDATQLYLDAALVHVEQRNRRDYAEAARLLLKVRALYRQRGADEDWTLFLAEFRDGFKMLRALRDEMNKAGV